MDCSCPKSFVKRRSGKDPGVMDTTWPRHIYVSKDTSFITCCLNINRVLHLIAKVIVGVLGRLPYRDVGAINAPKDHRETKLFLKIVHNFLDFFFQGREPYQPWSKSTIDGLADSSYHDGHCRLSNSKLICGHPKGTSVLQKIKGYRAL